MSNPVVRLLTAAAVIPLVLFLLLLPNCYFFCVFVTVICVLGLHETFLLIQSRGYRPYVAFGYAMAVGIQLALYPGLARSGFFSALIQPGMLVTILVLGLLVGLLVRGRIDDNVPSLGMTLFAVLYVAWMSGYLVRLRCVSDGAHWVFLLIAMTWVFDSSAYAWGVNFGRTKMWVEISPGKSWEGFWGGTFTTLAVVWLAKQVPDLFPEIPYLFPRAVSTPHLMVLTLVTCATAQVGDLVESMLKRYSRLKDSGFLFPGHGGVMDRIDSFLFTAPLVYYYAALFRPEYLMK